MLVHVFLVISSCYLSEQLSRKELIQYYYKYLYYELIYCMMTMIRILQVFKINSVQDFFLKPHTHNHKFVQDTSIFSYYFIKTCYLFLFLQRSSTQLFSTLLFQKQSLQVNCNELVIHIMKLWESESSPFLQCLVCIENLLLSYQQTQSKKSKKLLKNLRMTLFETTLGAK